MINIKMSLKNGGLKMKKNYTLLSVTLILFLIFSSCSKEENNMEGSNAVSNETDAYYVGMSVAHSFKNLCPNYGGDWTYSNKTIAGSTGGSATVSGSFTKTTYSSSYKTVYKYSNISIEYNNYCIDNDYATLTGSASAGGTLTSDASYYSGNSYSGSWSINANVALSGKYSGNATVSVTFTSKSDWSATVNTNGQTWYVDNAK